MRLTLYALAAAAALYLGDTAWSTLHPSFDNVHVERFLAIREKFNKLSYEPTDPRDERCIHAIFPHQGSRPCWYAARHRSEIVELN